MTKYILSVLLLCTAFCVTADAQKLRRELPVIADHVTNIPEALIQKGKFTGAVTLQNGDERWNSVFGNLHVNGVVFELFKGQRQGEDVYLGGEFDSVGGVPAKKLALFHGISGTFEEVGGGVSGGKIYAIFKDGDNLYVGGNFTSAGGVPVHNIAMWDGKAWYPLGDGTDGTVITIAKHGEFGLLVGGNFSKAGGKKSTSIAVWSTGKHEWAPITTNDSAALDGGVATILAFPHGFYVGGGFAHAGLQLVNKIAFYNDTTGWESVGNGVGGVNAFVASIAIGADYDIDIESKRNLPIYICGDFSIVGKDTTSNLAGWNGEKWFTYGKGLNKPAYKIQGLGYDAQFVVVGDFTIADEIPASHIVSGSDRSSNLQTFGSGLDEAAFALAGSIQRKLASTTLISFCVGGEFIIAGGKIAPNFSIWHYTTGSVASDSKQSQRQLLAYPNPANASVKLRSDDDLFSATLRAVDMLGREYALPVNRSQSEIEADTRALRDGIYLLEARTNTGTAVTRITIRH